MDEKEYVELIEQRAMVMLPENAVAVTIKCKVYDSDAKDLVSCEKTMSISEIRKAFQDAEDNYMDDDDTFVITDKGMKWLEGNKDKL